MYYIFTVNGHTANRLGYYYSEVDMSKNGGNGDIVKKNIALITHTPSYPEFITAVNHQNKIDIWVVLFNDNTSEFWAYLVTKNGVSTTPVKTSFAFGDQRTYIGKASPDGSKIVFTSFSNGFILSDFNSSDGKLNNITTMDSGLNYYGAEFSPNSKFLYLGGSRTKGWTSHYNIYQFSMEKNTPAEIMKSITTVASVKAPLSFYGLQLGPDGKLWSVTYGSDYLHCIEKPDEQGKGCNFIANKVYLGGKTSFLGLPTFIQSFFKAEISLSTKCFGDTSWFYTKDSSILDSVTWNFGDSKSGSNNISKGFRVFHLFSDTGKFIITSVAWQNGKKDTTILEVDQHKYLGRFSELDSIIYKCIDDTLVLTIKEDEIAKRIKWKNDTIGIKTLEVNEGYTWVRKYFGAQCYMDDSIKIINYPGNRLPGSIFIGDDISKCFHDSVILSFKDSGLEKYIWGNGVSDKPLKVINPDTISLKAFYGNSCFATDTIIVSNFPVTWPKLISDTVICDSISFKLGDPANSFKSYLWSNKSTQSTITVNTTDIYFLTVKDENNCETSDTSNVRFSKTPKIDLGNNRFFCDTFNTLYLDAGIWSDETLYQWNTSDTISKIEVTQPGNYFVKVSNLCGEDNDSIEFNLFKTPQSVLKPDYTICDMDSVILRPDIVSDSNIYFWNTGTTEAELKTNQPGNYSLITSNQCGKDTAYTTINALLTPLKAKGLNDTDVCDQSMILLRAGIPGNSEFYQWKNETKNLVVSDSNSISINEPGLYSLRQENFCGFRADTFRTRFLSMPVVHLPQDTFLCNNANVTVTPFETFDENNDYSWNTGESSYSTNVSNTGKYILEVSNTCGSSNDSIIIIKFKSPFAGLPPDKNYCDSFPHVMLRVGIMDNGENYKWIDGSEKDHLLVTTPGLYWVDILNSCGFSNDSTIMRSAFSPIIDLGKDTALCGDFELILDAGSSNSNFYWLPGEETTQKIAVNKFGNYILKATSAMGCVSWDTIAVKEQCNPRIYFPNAFSPNGDNLNDVFRPTFVDYYDFELTIFNRWGEKLFLTNDIESGWDGSYKNSICPDGVYMYIIGYRDVKNHIRYYKKGTVTITK